MPPQESKPRLTLPNTPKIDGIVIAKTDFTTNGIELQLNRIDTSKEDLVHERILFDTFVDVMQKALAGVPMDFETDDERALYDFLVRNHGAILRDILAQDIDRANSNEFPYFPYAMRAIAKKKQELFPPRSRYGLWAAREDPTIDKSAVAIDTFLKDLASPKNALTYLFLDSLHVPLDTRQAHNGSIGLQISNDPYVIFQTSVTSDGDLALRNEFVSTYFADDALKSFSSCFFDISIPQLSDSVIEYRTNQNRNVASASLVTSLHFSTARKQIKSLYTGYGQSTEFTFQSLGTEYGIEQQKKSTSCILSMPSWLAWSARIIISKNSTLTSISFNGTMIAL